MGFWADLFGFKKEEETEWRGIICDPGKGPIKDYRYPTNLSFEENSALTKRLIYLESLLNGYFKEIWGVVCTSPESRRKFVLEQNKKLNDTITEYHQVRKDLGYAFFPLEEVPDENLYNKVNNIMSDYYTEPLIVPESQLPQSLELFDQKLAIAKSEWQREVELKKIEMEKELRKYELQLQVQSKNYELQLEVERLKLEVERLTHLLTYQN